MILTLDELSAVVLAWKQAGLKVGFTCGSFDLLHAGHADYLMCAKERCDRLVVAVNSDESIRRYKSPFRPIIGEADRLKLVAALRWVDAVTLMEETRPIKLIEALKPDLYIKGGDYEVQELRSAPLVESYGGRCEVIPVLHSISSSTILQRIEEKGRYANPEAAPGKKGQPIVFLDRDGTLIENVAFPREPSRVRLMEGVGEGLRKLQEAGFTLVVVTNQQGIGLGYYGYDDFVAVNSEMLKQLDAHRSAIARFYFCPHSVADRCLCRKPQPGLIERGLRDFEADAGQCFVIGDSQSDMDAAAAAGCRGILFRNNFSEVVETILGARA